MVFALLGEKKRTLLLLTFWEQNYMSHLLFISQLRICIECCWGQQSVHNLKESDVIPTSLILCCPTPFLLGKMLYSNEMGWESNGLWHQKGTHPSIQPRQVFVHLSLRMWLSLGPIVLNKRNRSSMKRETRPYVFSIWGWKVPSLHHSGSEGQLAPLDSVPGS